MATIDAKKLLPPSKKTENSEKFLVPVTSIVPKRSVTLSANALRPVDKPADAGTSVSPSDNLVSKIVKVENILKSNLALQIKEGTRKDKEEKNKEAEEKEKKLEIKDDKKSKVPLPSLPRTGFLDALRNYFINTLLGFVAVKLFDMAPKLIKFLDATKPIITFIGFLGKNLFDGFVGFIENGYKAYDEVRKFTKTVGGENAQKLFDEFSKNLNLVLNGAIVAAGLAISTAPKGPGPKGVSGGLSAGMFGGRGYGYRPEPLPSGVKPGTTEGRAILKPQRQAARAAEKASRRVAGAALRRGITQETAEQAATQVAKQGAKQSLKSLTAVPIIGALIGFIIDTVIFKEKPTRAAAGAVGSAIGQGVGIALAGGTTFGLGAGIGMFVGGFVGDWIGKSLYDTIAYFNQQPIQGRAQGGQISTGGRTGTPTRSIKKTRRPVKRITPQKTQPGKDAGGLRKIEELYGTDEPGTRSALRALKKSSQEVKRVKSINGLSGAMFGAGIDMALGQKPDKNLARSLGDMFGSVVQNAIDVEMNSAFSDITKTLAMANGGVVPQRGLRDNMNIGERIGRYVSNAFSVAIENSASKVFENLRRELNLEGGPPGGPGGGDGGDGGDGSGGGMFTGKAADIPPEGKALLDAIAGSESGGYNSRYPSKTFDNGWRDHPRIRERILSGPNKGKTSDAAGRYQFLSSTWDQYKPAKAFTPENQDIAAYRLAVAAYGYGESGLIKDLKKDPLKVANKLSGTWTSLPGGIEPNNATNGFLARYKAKVKYYESTGGPSLSAKGVKKFSRTDITSFFRQQESFRSKPHEGMDIAAKQGTPISFGIGGEVIGVWRTSSVAREANGGYGTYMDVKFSDGRIARIAHLSNIPSSIKKGSKFRGNQIIAYSGGEEGKPGSGRSGGPHIHLEQLSKPMGIEETTKGKYDPLKGGLFDLMQRGGIEISSIQNPSPIAQNQPQSPSIASIPNLNGWDDSSTSIFAIQEIHYV